MHRTPIWDMPWFAIEVLLLGAFDWRELSNELNTTATPRACEREDPVTVLRIAHQACRERTPFARRIQRVLDYRYADFVQAANDMEGSTIGATLGATCLRSPETVAAVSWALARDPRPSSAEALECLLARVAGAALWQFMQRRSAPVPEESPSSDGEAR